MSRIPGLAERVPEHALQPVACGLCGSPEAALKFEDDPFRVVTCARCGLTYVTPRLADAALLEHVYDEKYWSSPAAKARSADWSTASPFFASFRRMPWSRASRATSK